MDTNTTANLMSQAEIWINKMEEFVVCPICWNIPQHEIHLCIQGHHICNSCLHSLNRYECPICKKTIHATRSYLGEHIISKIKELKSDIYNFCKIFSKQNHKILATTATQYDEKDLDFKYCHVNAAKGDFCCLIDSCNKIHPHCFMINHIRNVHPNSFLIDSATNGKIYQKSWKFVYSINLNYSIAIHINNMELFFINVKVDDNGDFHGGVRILNTNSVGKLFTCTLEIISLNNSSIYKTDTIIQSCYLRKNMIKDNLFINRSLLNSLLGSDNSFTLDMKISRSKLNTKPAKKNQRNNIKVKISNNDLK